MIERGLWLKDSTAELERRLELVGDELQELRAEYDNIHWDISEDDEAGYKLENKRLIKVRTAIRAWLARRENAYT
jgi:hypothetical protein